MQALLPGLGHQVHAGGAAALVLVGFGLGQLHRALLQQQAGVALCGALLPQQQAGGGVVGVGAGAWGGLAGLGQVGVQLGRGQAGAVGQGAALDVQLRLRGPLLGLQCGQAGLGFVGVGNGCAAQAVALLGGVKGLLHSGKLLLRYAQRFLCQGQAQVALGGAQHHLLLAGVPLQLGHVGLQLQLLLLGTPLGVVQGLAGLQLPACGRAAGDGGGKVHPPLGAHARGRELRPAHFAFAAAQACGQRQRHAGAPQGGGLRALGLGALQLGTGHGQLAVVLLCGLPGLQQVGGASQRGQGHQAGGQGEGAKGGAHRVFRPWFWRLGPQIGQRLRWPARRTSARGHRPCTPPCPALRPALRACSRA